MTFKIGDKVEVVGCYNGEHAAPIGSIGEIASYSSVGIEEKLVDAYLVRFSKYPQIIREIDLKKFNGQEIETKSHAPIVYKVYDFLKQFVGKNNAVSAYTLAGYFAISKRDVRRIIHEIRDSKELEKAIGCCNAGYYICTEEDAKQAIERLYRQAKSTFKVAYAMEKKVGLNGQGKIALGEYFAPFYESLGDEE